MDEMDQPGAARRFPVSRRAKMGLGAAALLAVGGAAGAGAIALSRPSIEMAPLAPTAIARVATSSGPVTIRGRVAEVFGNKFVLQDGSGRALVDTGREGDDRFLVTAGAPATVQGRFDRGFLHASFLVDGSGHVTALGPMGEPRRHGRHGPRPDDAPPPPEDGPAPPAPAPAN